MSASGALLNSSFEKDLYKINNFFYINKNQEALKFDYLQEFRSDLEILDSKEDYENINLLVSELNNAIQINLNEIDDDEIGCQEILSLLKKSKHNKINKYKNKKAIFKNLSKPKKISLKGKVFSDIQSIDTQSSSNQQLTGTTSTVSINSTGNKNNNKNIK